MATTPLAYNPSASPIAGTSQVGSLAVGTSDQDYSIEPGGVTWWMGPEQSTGYIIAIPVSGNTQPTPISGITASLGFYQTSSLTDNSFIELTNNIFGQSFTGASEASSWLTTNGYWNSYGISFTLNSSDFTNGQAIYHDTLVVGTNGVDGFINTAAQGGLEQGYIGYGLTPSAISYISSAVTAAGLDPNNFTGYIWSVTWGAGSSILSGLVKFGYYGDGGQFDIQTVDPTDTDWQIPGNLNGTSLVGTFLFPATFTIYNPLTNKGGWC